jgi:predicted Na+-dependent transporter
MLSTSFKNDALAASIAVQAGGPVAVLPAVGSLVAEMALMLGVSLFAARRASGVGNAEYQAAQTNTSGTQPAQPA